MLRIQLAPVKVRQSIRAAAWRAPKQRDSAGGRLLEQVSEIRRRFKRGKGPGWGRRSTMVGLGGCSQPCFPMNKRGAGLKFSVGSLSATEGRRDVVFCSGAR